MGSVSHLPLRVSRRIGVVARRTIRVVVAEDDPAMRVLLCNRLREEGFDVVEAPNGSALEQMIRLRAFNRRGAPSPMDLVIFDLRMPGGSGLDLLARLRRLDGVTPFILITAHGDRDTHAEAKRLGAAGVFVKPFDLEDLCTAVVDLVAC